MLPGRVDTMSEKKEEEVRRVLFELAVDNDGAIEWRLDPTLRPVLLFSVLGALELAREEILCLTSEAAHKGEDNE